MNVKVWTGLFLASLFVGVFGWIVDHPESKQFEVSPNTPAIQEALSSLEMKMNSKLNANVLYKLGTVNKAFYWDQDRTYAIYFSFDETECKMDPNLNQIPKNCHKSANNNKPPLTCRAEIKQNSEGNFELKDFTAKLVTLIASYVQSHDHSIRQDAKDVVGDAKDLVKKTAHGAGNVIAGAGNAVKKTVKGAENAVEGAGHAVKKTVKGAENAVEGAGHAVKKTVKGAGSVITGHNPHHHHRPSHRRRHRRPSHSHSHSQSHSHSHSHSHSQHSHSRRTAKPKRSYNPYKLMKRMWKKIW